MEFRKFIAERAERKVKHGVLRRRWSITTKVEENINCDVTIKVKCALLLCPLIKSVFGFFFFILINVRLVVCDFSNSLRSRRFAIEITVKLNILLSPSFQLNQKSLHLNTNLRSIATGSWGCGGQQAGDPQFKVVIQWLAASVANVPTLIYYTCAKESLSKLDTVARVLHGKFASRRNSFVDVEILRKFAFRPRIRSKVDGRRAAATYPFLCQGYPQQSHQQL